MEKDIKNMTLKGKIEDFNKYIKSKRLSLPLERMYVKEIEGDAILSVLFASKERLKKEEKSRYNNALRIARYYNTIVTRKEDSNCAAIKTYLYSNENVSEFYKHKDIKVKGGRVLLVGSSGDYLLNALLNGAKNITVCDLNMYTEMYTELKIALITMLKYNEFNNYVNRDFCNNFFENHKVYAKVSHLLTPKVKTFWDNVMLSGDKEDLKRIFHSGLIVKGSEFCTNEDVYYKLQNILKERKFRIRYIVEDFLSFPKVVKGEYKFMSFSNIRDYFYKISQFDKTLKKLYVNNLSQNGVIQVHTVVRDGEEKDWIEDLQMLLPNSEAFVVPKTGIVRGAYLSDAYSSVCVKKLGKKKETVTKKTVLPKTIHAPIKDDGCVK